jgi:putative membrane protein
MKNLASVFLSQNEQKKIIEAVKEVERITSGEVVPMVVSASYHYPLSNVIGGLTLSLVLSIAVCLITGYDGMWSFLGIATPLFILMHQMVKAFYPLKRMFISDREIDEEVEEAALKNFYAHGLYRTRDETGVLIFISVFEHRVRVLADRGINRVVPASTWDEIVAIITDGIRKKQQGEAIVRAVVRVGEILKSSFPVRPDDRDELKNLIIEG